MAVVVLVLVVVAAVVVDRVGAAAAERLAREKVEQRLDLTGTPEIDVHGFPFLTQVLAGSLDDVTGHAEGLTVDGTTLTDVDASAQGVSTSEPYAVQHVELSATLTTQTLQDLVRERTGVDVTVAVEGDQLVATGTVLGLPLGARLTPHAQDGQLRVDVTDVQLAGASIALGSLPGGAGAALSDLTIPLDGLPEGVTVTDAHVVAQGVRVTATGTDVLLTGGR